MTIYFHVEDTPEAGEGLKRSASLEKFVAMAHDAGSSRPPAPRPMVDR